jgi:putative FmdB family regulatory protein
MPTYEYTCPDGHDFEQFVLKMSQGSAHLPCPVCGKASARKISAGGGLLFKGSGFYITDYGKDGKKDQRTGAKSGSSPNERTGTGESPAGVGAKDSPKDSPRDSAKDSSRESPRESSKESAKDSAKPTAAPAAPAAKKKSDTE